MVHPTASQRSEISEEMTDFKEKMKELITKGVEEAIEKAMEAVRQSLAEWALERKITAAKQMGAVEGRISRSMDWEGTIVNPKRKDHLNFQAEVNSTLTDFQSIHLPTLENLEGIENYPGANCASLNSVIHGVLGMGDVRKGLVGRSLIRDEFGTGGSGGGPGGGPGAVKVDVVTANPHYSVEYRPPPAPSHMFHFTEPPPSIPSYIDTTEFSAQRVFEVIPDRNSVLDKARKISLILDKAPKHLQSDLVALVPKLVEQSEHPLAACALLDRLQKTDAEPALRLPVFGALSQLECSSEVWERVLSQSFELLADSNDEPLVVTVDFIFKAALHCQHLPETVRSVCTRLKTLCVEVSICVLGYLGRTVNSCADIAEAILKDIECDDDCSTISCGLFLLGQNGSSSDGLNALEEQAFRATATTNFYDIYILIEMLSIPCLVVEASRTFERAVACGSIMVESVALVLERRLARRLNLTSQFVAENFQNSEVIVEGEVIEQLRAQQDDFSLVLGHGFLQEVHVYVYGSETCAAFITHMDDKDDKIVYFHGKSVHVPAWSVSILPDCKNVVFNTVKVGSQSSHVEMATSDLNPSGISPKKDLKWDVFTEKAGVWVDADNVQQGFIDHIDTTKDTTDYLWYTTRLHVNGNEDFLRRGREPMLLIESKGQAVHSFVNYVYHGSAAGTVIVSPFTFEILI